MANLVNTRMHSSRMHTACLLAVSPSMHCTGGVSAQGGVCSGGVSAPGVPGPGGCLLRGWGVPGPWGRGLVSQHALRQIPL